MKGSSPAHQTPDPILQPREVTKASLGPRCTYPLGEVEGSNAQWPEAAKHGEESETQVVPRRQREKIVFTFTLC